MVNINFVPDDYVQGNESSRTNLMYLILFLVVMTALSGSFLAIKIRQRAANTHEKLVNKRMARIQETIKKFEELQTKRRAMMKTALMTAELLEPVPRSVLLASLTNNLPVGVSLTQVGMVQKEPKKNSNNTKSSKYKAARAENSEDETKLSPEQMLETHISIGGMAPTDLQVASYIERLTSSNLLDDVALVESKEFVTNDNSTFRKFKLTAMLKRSVHLTKADVDNIKGKAQESIWNF
jgi:Tfp pilus assembly protein PilN